MNRHSKLHDSDRNGGDASLRKSHRKPIPVAATASPPTGLHMLLSPEPVPDQTHHFSDTTNLSAIPADALPSGGDAGMSHATQQCTSDSTNDSTIVMPLQEMSGLAPMDPSGDVDFGFDWTLSSEDIFNILRADPSTVNLSFPIPQYSPDPQTSLTNGSFDGNPPAINDGSVDASREAVQVLSKIIKDFPAKLDAEFQSNNVVSSFFDDGLDLFFTRFLSALPIIHKPTFHARDCGATLLLNMLALGSTFIGSKEATLRVSSSREYL